MEPQLFITDFTAVEQEHGLRRWKPAAVLSDGTVSEPMGAPKFSTERAAVRAARRNIFWRNGGPTWYEAPRRYYGRLIHPANPNPMGMRWESEVNGRWLRADTLAGVKDLIRRELRGAL